MLWQRWACLTGKDKTPLLHYITIRHDSARPAGESAEVSKNVYKNSGARKRVSRGPKVLRRVKGQSPLPPEAGARLASPVRRQKTSTCHADLRSAVHRATTKEPVPRRPFHRDPTKKAAALAAALIYYLKRDMISCGLSPATWLSPGLMSCSKRAFLRWPRATTCSSMEPWVTRRMTSTLRVWPMR